MTKFMLFFISASLLFATEFSYKDQKNWQFISGKSQSPIDINTSKVVEPEYNLGRIRVHYSLENPKVVLNNGHTIKVVSSGKATLNDRVFLLDNLHLHSPSEHTINSKHYPLELHFVHKAEDGRLAVIAVFAKEGAFNPEFQKLLDGIKTGRADLKLKRFIPKSDRDYYHYLGSLTTPPLSENVEWYVLKTPIEVSKKQIEEFNEYYNGNNRLTQPLNGRKILVRD